ncbi:hypothetical protein LTR97_012457 [Elasticomyces elasticus]|uniref:C2H2-type domain-containing protein n=1 Tax=Elasticomyces elasticus TaxID=574655 RepID=A0AAN7VXP4_9PEZI|nr:hypothetical protein LTR97_012457 [Elasticomyces elasticus]
MESTLGFTPTAVHMRSTLAPIVEEQDSNTQDDARALLPSNAPVRKRKRVDLTCTRCSESFTERRSLTRHETYGTAKCPRITENKKLELCTYPGCGESFVQAYNRDRHEKEVHCGEKRSAPLAHTTSLGDVDYPIAIVQRVRGPLRMAANSDISWTHAAEGNNTAIGVVSAKDNAISPSTLSTSSAPHGSNGAEESSSSGRNSVSAGHDSAIELCAPPCSDKQASQLRATKLLTAGTAATHSPRTSSPVLTPGTRPHMASREHQTADNYTLPGDVMDIDWTLDLPEYYNLADMDDMFRLAHTVSSPAEPGHGTAADLADTESIRSASTTFSISSVRRQILHGTAKRVSSLVRGRGTLITRAQKCSMCGKLYEQDLVMLKEHLDAHLRQLQAEETWPTCHTCEVGFVREQDLRHHLRSAQDESCCTSPLGHDGPCKGYRCGYDFSHDVRCNGHHAPTASGGTWSDHDRFKFGQFMRKWELAQLKTVMSEVSNVQRARSLRTAFDRISMPELRPLSQFSKVSLLSGRSEPIQHRYDVASLQEKMTELDIHGPSAFVLRNATEVLGMQSLVNEKLLLAVKDNDVDSARKLLRNGAQPDVALQVAVNRCHGRLILYLIQAGAVVDAHVFYGAVLACKAKSIKQLLTHRDAPALLLRHGAVMLSLAVRLHDTDMILALQEAGTDLNEGPANEAWTYFLTMNFGSSIDATAHAIRSHIKSNFDWSLFGRHPYHDPPLCVAASLGEVSTLACLIASGANLHATGSKGTALEIAVLGEHEECIDALLEADTQALTLDGAGNTPLDHAVNRRNARTVKLLLERTGTFGSMGIHALFIDSQSSPLEEIEIVGLFLAHGIDVNATDANGFTPLHRAMLQGRDRLCEHLLQAGADPEDLARWSRRSQAFQRIRDGCSNLVSQIFCLYCTIMQAWSADFDFAREPLQHAQLTPDLDNEKPHSQQYETNVVNTYNVPATDIQHGSFTCEWCSKTFTERRTLTRHQTYGTKQCPSRRREWCTYPGCTRMFARPDTRKRHELERHEGKKRSAWGLKRLARIITHQLRMPDPNSGGAMETCASPGCQWVVAPDNGSNAIALPADEPAVPATAFQLSNSVVSQNPETIVDVLGDCLEFDDWMQDPDWELNMPPDIDPSSTWWDGEPTFMGGLIEMSYTPQNPSLTLPELDVMQVAAKWLSAILCKACDPPWKLL